MPKNLKVWVTVFVGMTAFLLFSPSVHAAFYDDEPKISTEPIGSPYYRHVAQEMNVDLRELVKFEKRGFGRTEILMLIYISSSTGVPLKEYGKRRIKDKVTLRTLCEEAKLDYDTLHTKSVDVKKRIEFLGSDALPPPLYELPKSTETIPAKVKKEKKKKESKEKDKEEAINPAASPTPTDDLKLD